MTRPWLASMKRKMDKKRRAEFKADPGLKTRIISVTVFTDADDSNPILNLWRVCLSCIPEAARVICKKTKDEQTGKVTVCGTKFLRATQTYPREFCRVAAEKHAMYLGEAWDLYIYNYIYIYVFIALKYIRKYIAILSR